MKRLGAFQPENVGRPGEAGKKLATGRLKEKDQYKQTALNKVIAKRIRFQNPGGEVSQ